MVVRYLFHIVGEAFKPPCFYAGIYGGFREKLCRWADVVIVPYNRVLSETGDAWDDVVIVPYNITTSEGI